jgi:para-aminobenzoate synthetase/4-amino-4-deoxychorismate lyase
VRVALRADGRLRRDAPPLPPPDPAWFDAQGRVRVVPADAPLTGRRPLAGHKSTWRARYDAGVRAAEARSAFDSLFFDAQDRLIEGGRSSVLVRLDGRWFTPPRHLGVLPGLVRARWLVDPALDVQEREITRADLARAEAMRVGNALRGTLPAVLVGIATAGT